MRKLPPLENHLFLKPTVYPNESSKLLQADIPFSIREIHPRRSSLSWPRPQPTQELAIVISTWAFLI